MSPVRMLSVAESLVAFQADHMTMMKTLAAILLTWWAPQLDTAPIRAETSDEAILSILQGKVVELVDVVEVNEVLTRFADMAREAEALGKAAPSFDLCRVHVARSNFFCGDSLRSKKYPHGVPRIEMPQLEGKPVPGSLADSLPRSRWDPSEVDGSAEFIAYLRAAGVGVSEEVVPAAHLKASQCELVGKQVAALMVDASFDPVLNPVFISEDNYLVDGHHRWAAVLGRDAADGTLGESTMIVVRVSAPIAEILRIANQWAAAFGIQHAAGSSPLSCSRAAE